MFLNQPPDTLTVSEAARLLNVNRGYLDHLRSKRKGPTFLRSDAGIVLYKIEEIKQWMREREEMRQCLKEEKVRLELGIDTLVEREQVLWELYSYISTPKDRKRPSDIIILRRAIRALKATGRKPSIPDFSSYKGY